MVIIFASSPGSRWLDFVYINYWADQAIVSVSDNKWMPLTGIPIHWVWYEFPNTMHSREQPAKVYEVVVCEVGTRRARMLRHSYPLRAHVTAGL